MILALMFCAGVALGGLVLGAWALGLTRRAPPRRFLPAEPCVEELVAAEPDYDEPPSRVHLAGEHDPERGQRCLVCGEELACGHGSQAWRAGALVLKSGRPGSVTFLSDVSDADEVDAEHCEPTRG